MYKIVNGPDKQELSSAFVELRSVKFEVAHINICKNKSVGGKTFPLEIRLSFLELEDGSGNNFNIVGYIIHNGKFAQKVKIFYRLAPQVDGIIRNLNA